MSNEKNKMYKEGIVLNSEEQKTTVRSIIQRIISQSWDGKYKDCYGFLYNRSVYKILEKQVIKYLFGSTVTKKELEQQLTLKNEGRLAHCLERRRGQGFYQFHFSPKRISYLQAAEPDEYYDFYVSKNNNGEDEFIVNIGYSVRK